MARIFDIKITSGTSHSLYTIYYDQVDAANIATRVSTSLPATGVTYNDLTSGSGVTVSVPNNATSILLYNNSCVIDDEIILPTPTPSPTPTNTPTPSPTSSPTPSPTPSPSPTETPTPTPSPSPTNTPTPSPTTSPTPTPTPSPTPNCDFDMDINVVTPTPTPTPSPTSSPTPTPTSTPTPTPSPSPSPTETPTPTPSPTTSPTPTPTSTPTPTPSPTPNCDFDVDVTLNTRPSIIVPNFSQTENTATGTTIGNLVASDDEGGTFTWVFEDTASYPDNNSFSLTSGGVLSNAEVFNHEVKSLYTLYVKVTDNGGLTNTREFTVDIVDVNETPYGLTLSNNTQRENTPIGTTIGIFSGLDVDSGETFTYSLTGSGNDNASFALSSGGVLKNDIVFNYEVKNSYEIEVTVTDSGNNTYTDTFTISILDVNESPTNLSLSSDSIEENQSTGTTIGTFSSTDVDSGDSHSYELVSGLGDTNNDSFTLTSGGILKSKEVYNYEGKNSYSIRVKTTDSGGLTYIGIFTILITDVNETPSNITPATVSFQENQSTGTTVTTFSATDVDSGDTHTFELVTGIGDTNNDSFILTSGGVLKSNEVFNYEVKNSYTIRVKVTDSGGLVHERSVTINITNANEAPTDITLLDNNIPENSSTGTTVGQFSTTDPDAGNTFTYTLVSGVGDTNNSSFNISGNKIQSSEVFNYEVKNTYSVRVRSTDQGGLYREESFTINVTNVNETPTNISLSNSSIDENVATGTTVGTLSTTDPDAGNTFTYTLVSGVGDTNNGSFNIDGTTLKSSEVFDYETKNSYAIRVRTTDQGGLWYEKKIIISITNISVSGTATVTNLNCYNDSSGTIEVTSQTGGDSPYTYSINGLTYQSSTSFTGLGAGTYTVRIKDDNGEIGTLSKTITQPPVLSVTDSHTDPTCYGGSDGQIQFSVTGGTGEITYTLNGVSTTDLLHENLSAANYAFIATDENGCTASRTVVLHVLQVSATVTQSNVTCNGGSDGWINVTSATGGSGSGYEVKLNSNGTYVSLGDFKVYSNLSAGTYTIYVKDGDGCERTYSITITEPAAVTFTETHVDPTCWNGKDGSITVSASGGNGSYEYQFNGFWQSSNTKTGLTTGSKSVRVRDGNGCTSSFGYVTLSTTKPSATITSTNVVCNGDDDGTISVSNPTGGSGATYQVKLNSNGTYVNLTGTQLYEDLSPDTYSIYIKDSDGCEGIYTATITENNAVTASTASTNPTCFGDTDGSITVTGSGGTGSYTYSIGSGYQSSNSFTGLGNGIYSVNVKDSNGCVGTTTVTLLKTQVSATIYSNQPSCFGDTDGDITLSSITGGNSGTYQYKFESGNWTNFSSTVTFTNKSAGTYTIQVRDSQQCSRSYSYTLGQPTAVTSSVSVTHPSCANSKDGSVTITGGGGSGSYLYSIDGSNYYLINNFIKLSVGSGTAYVKDSNNCISTVPYTLTKTDPTATISVTNALCNGDTGSITVSNPSGGNGGAYQVKLDTGSYQSFSSNSYTFTSVNVGNHVITIKDGDGCTRGYTRSVTEPTSVVVGYNSLSHPSCSYSSDGSINFTVSGGSGSYTYRLNGTLITNITVTGLTTGSYVLYAEDTNGCSDSISVNLVKSAPSATVTASNPTCSSGSGTITVASPAGGNGPTYESKIGNGTYTTIGSPTIYSPLSSGTYTITIKDGDGCTRTYNRTITIPTAVSFTTSVTHPTCNGDSDGEITFSASGGNGSYQYSINNGINYQSNNTFSNLTVGTYLLRVKDGVNCSTTGTVTLSKTDPNATFTMSSVSCNGGSDGEIEVSSMTGGNGGTYSHRYGLGSWLTTSPHTYSSLSAGNHYITIKDGSGCTEAYTITVTEPTAQTVSITSVTTTTGSTGSITVTSTGGVWPKTYRLYEDTTSPYTVGGGTLVATITGVTSANHSQTFSNLSEGYYYVVVTDANGCTASSVTIESTFDDTNNGDPKGPVVSGVADLKIQQCTTGQIYYARSDRYCSDGNLSLQSHSVGVGDIVQFAIGDNCPIEGGTYCGEVIQTGLEVASDVMITNDFFSNPINNCEDFDCFE